MFDLTLNLLNSKGIQVRAFERESDDLINIWSKIHAFEQGIYSTSTKRLFSSLLKSWQPHVVHVHNVYPLISPSVLVASRECGVPVVMRCPNYRLICPTGLLERNGAICELCVGGSEYWCLFTNCRGNVFESFSYAARSMLSRIFGFFRKNVTCYIAPTNFVKRRLVNAGFPEEKMFVIPNMVSIPNSEGNAASGKYGAYVGRISHEKGLNILLGAAQKTGLPIHIAGDYSGMPEIIKEAPTNVNFVGRLKNCELTEFYQGARFLILPSICFETFGLAAAEGMSHGLPVIASRIGGLQEVVDDESSGFLVEPGNVEDLATKMTYLWDNPELCSQMGCEGRNKAIQEYSEEIYYSRLVDIYKKAIEINKDQS